MTQKILEFESPSWIQSYLLPKLEQIVNLDNTYLKKITAFYALGVIAQHYGGSVMPKAVSIISSGIESKVPNVRLVTIKVLGQLYGRADKDELTTIRK